MTTRSSWRYALMLGMLAILCSAARGDRPVVIIGGWGNEPDDYARTALVAALTRPRPAGAPSPLFLSKHQDPYQDIDKNAVFEAERIREFLDGLKRANAMQGSEFDLIGHSMGGLISRAIILKHQDILGPYRVANLVTLGTPNHGASFTLTTLDQVNPQAKLGGRSTVASSQMNPASPFLHDLNSRRIPPTVRVTTIAGDIRLETPPTPLHQTDSREVPCVHLVAQHTNDSVPTPCTHFKSCVHQKTAFGKTVRLHPNDGPEHASDSKRVPCVHKIKQHPSDSLNTPCTHLQSGKQTTGSDGFIYVASVKLLPTEAADIVANKVYPDVYHTTSTRDRWMNAPEKVNKPFPGKPVDGKWLFEDERIVADVTSILNQAGGSFPAPRLQPVLPARP